MSRLSVPLVATLGGGSIGQELDPLSGTRIFSDFGTPYSDWKTEQTASSGFAAPTYSGTIGINPNIHGVATIVAANPTAIDTQSRIADRLRTDPAATLKVGYAEMDFLVRLKFDRTATAGMSVRLGFFCDHLFTPTQNGTPKSAVVFRFLPGGAVNIDASNEFDGSTGAGYSVSQAVASVDYSLWHTYGIYIPKNGSFARYTIDGVVVGTIFPTTTGGNGSGTSGPLPNTSATVGLNVGVEAYTLGAATTSVKTLSIDFMRYRYLHERIA